MACSVNTIPGEAQIKRFLAVLNKIHDAPWSNKYFAVNRAMILHMASSWLWLIVGKENAERYGAELRALLSLDCALTSGSISWICNRQQGKTTSTSIFIAALSLVSQQGGNLCFIYSTSLDRACEVLKATKSYVYWVLAQEPKMSELTGIKIGRDNQREFMIVDPDGTAKLLMARPRTIESCRGDAPASVVVDEAAFVRPDWFTSFLKPLFSVKDRLFLLVTTPPPNGGFFQTWIDSCKEAREKYNDDSFQIVNHSLVCKKCLESGVGGRCTHNLKYIPPWKSILRLQSILRVTPARQRANFQVEMLGVVQQTTDGYLPRRHLKNLFDVAKRNPAPHSDRIFVAVDPASHFRSQMGLAAIVSNPETGQIVLAGCASVSVDRCTIELVLDTLDDFLRKLRRIPNLDCCQIVPIIECNHSEVTAKTLLSVFRRYPPHAMPFLEEYFPTGVSTGIGVRTTRDTKISSLTTTAAMLADNQLAIASNSITTDERVAKPQALPVSSQEALKTLHEQLAMFRDHEDGTVSGITDAGGHDDCGMAFLMAVFWRRAILQQERGSGP